MSPGVDHQLAHLGTTVIAFANNSYQSIELRRFALPPGAAASDRELLAALIGSPGYSLWRISTGRTPRLTNPSPRTAIAQRCGGIRRSRLEIADAPRSRSVRAALSATS